MNAPKQVKRQIKLFGRTIYETRATLANPPTWLTLFGSEGTESASGKNVTATSALSFSAFYACVKIIAETMASLKIGIEREEGDNIVQDKKNPVYPLLAIQPSNLISRFNFWESIYAQYLVWGNGYAYIESNQGGIAKNLVLIDQTVTDVDITINKRGNLIDVFYEFTESDNEQKLSSGGVLPKGKIPSKDVLHIANMGYNGIEGKSVISMFKDTIGLPLASKEFAGKFYGNGTNVGGILTHPNKVSKEAQTTLRNSWNKLFQGSEKSFKTAVLEEGMTYQKLGMPLTDAQFIESQKFNVEEMARIFRVPLHLLQELDRSTNNNIEQQSIDFVMHTIRPNAERGEAEMDRKLLPAKDYKSGKVHTRFDINELLRGDLRGQTIWAKEMRTQGILNSDEIRRKFGFNPIEDGSGKTYIVNSANIPLDKVGENMTNEQSNNNSTE